MIIGIGNDIVSVDRIKKVDERQRYFRERILTERELSAAAGNIERVAGYFAAKEAASKALGTGIGLVTWKDIEITYNEAGAPQLGFFGEAARLAALRGVQRIFVSISHERTYATAMVVLEGRDVCC